MSIGQEVEADLPGPLSELSVLPSYDAIQLIGPGATIWHLTEYLMRKRGCRMVECKILGETEINDQRTEIKIKKLD